MTDQLSNQYRTRQRNSSFDSTKDESIASFCEWYVEGSTADVHHHHHKKPHLIDVPSQTKIPRSASEQILAVYENPSNEILLGIAFLTFLLFTVAQAIAAIFFAHSQAMIGDCWAMFVDAGTYLLNYAAERGKQVMHVSHKEKLILELVPPLASVTTLVIVTIWVMKTAIMTILHPTNANIPSLGLMMAFSVANLVLDIVNVICFARGEGMESMVTGYTVVKKNGSKSAVGEDKTLIEENDKNYQAIPIEEEWIDDEIQGNLNMCSAYTHVAADTLRSIAVLLAAGIAYFTPLITPEIADAVAALIVSLIIVVSLFPLFGGLMNTYRELRQLNHAEEQNFNCM